jgi:SAM-dependent methyltransferase
MKPLTVKTMLGMGDNLWSRPIVRALARQHELTLITPWPQCYIDLAIEHGIEFARADTHLRTQAENIVRFDQPQELAPGVVVRWKPPWRSQTPGDRPPLSSPREPAFRLAYDPREIRKGTTHHDSLEASAKAFLNGAGVSPADIALKIPETWQAQADELLQCWVNQYGKPVVLIRPPTVRSEWLNSARNCDPIALQQIIDLLAPDYTLVGIAHLKRDAEWLARPEPRGLDVECYSGELPLEVLLGLMRRTWSIGANGFLLPMAIAMGGPAYVLFGGNWGYNAPENLLHPAYDLSRIGWSVPDRPCAGCIDGTHTCDKRIDPERLRMEFDAWRARQSTDEVAMGNALRTSTFGRAYYEEHKAAGLDYLGHGDWQRRYGAWLASVLGWTGMPVLDVGCACGSILKGFVHAGVDAHGVDVNEHMIALGRAEWPELAHRLACCDAVNLHPFSRASFGGIHSAQVAEHWRPELVPHILAELRRIARHETLMFLCMDTSDLYLRQGRTVAKEDPTHFCVEPMDWWRDQLSAADWEDRTKDFRPRLIAHPLSMLVGSTSDSRAKYDWDFLVLEAS